MRILMIAAAAAATASVPVLASENRDANARVCKSVPTTGTRLSRERVCMSRAEWDRLHRESERAGERAISEQTRPAPGE